jgi:antitoxin (DNA-binding transcriptional repressor) of toxin-antitoxin stability system
MSAPFQTGGRTVRAVREIPVEQVPEDIAEAARAAARGEIVFLTEDGERLAAIVPSGYAAELEDLSPDEVLELLDDMAAGQPEP